MIITPTLVIFMILVFVLLFLFLNTVDPRKWLTIIISIILTPIVYFYVFYPFINIISNYHHQKYFNSESWTENPALRYEMIDNTLESEVLIGKSKDSIITLLGSHEWLSWDDERKMHNDNKWNYGLGIEPGAFNDKKECVEVVFSGNKVIALRLYQEDISFENGEE